MEETFVLAMVLGLASFVVVPFLSWGLSDPGGQWSTIQTWRHGRSEELGELAESAYGKQRLLNLVVLVLWVSLVVVAFRTLG